MGQIDPAQLDVDAMMREIRAEIEGRMAPSRSASRVAAGSVTDVVAGAPVMFGRLGEPKETLPEKREYALGDFLCFHDEDFIRNAYRGILGREPDPEGGSRFLAQLRDGNLAKVEVLGRIRYSPEGRAAKVMVKGLIVPFAIRTTRRIPVLGHLLAVGQYVFRLPNLVKNLERLESVVFFHRYEIRRGVNQVVAEIESAARNAQSVGAEISRNVAALDARQEGTETRLGAKFNALETRLAAKSERAEILDIEQRLRSDRRTLEDGLFGRIEAVKQAVRDEMQAIAERHGEVQKALFAAVTSIEESKADRAGLAEIAARQSRIETEAVQLRVIAEEEERRVGDYYAVFEDEFRGSRDDIKNRVRVYLPYIRAANAGTSEAPVLDIGCGRGEWLELLRDEGLLGCGVDRSRTMIGRCRDLGLAVEEADAIAYLRQLKASSLGAVTAMHVIEHIPFASLLSLFDEVRRVLMPGGVAIFETPNPENLVVGACTFYYDPTHIRPLPPEPMRFLLENRGFARVEILRLHPRHDRPALPDGANDLDRSVDGRLYGEQDYSLIGWT